MGYGCPEGGAGRHKARGTLGSGPRLGSFCPGSVWSRLSQEVGVCWSVGSELAGSRSGDPMSPGPVSGSQPQTTHEKAGFAKWPSIVLAGRPQPRKRGSYRGPCRKPHLGPVHPMCCRSHVIFKPRPHPCHPAPSHSALGPHIPRCCRPSLLPGLLPPWGQLPSSHLPLSILCASFSYRNLKLPSFITQWTGSRYCCPSASGGRSLPPRGGLGC